MSSDFAAHLKIGFLWWAFAHHKRLAIIFQRKPGFGSEAAFTKSHKAMYRYKPGLIFKKAKFEVSSDELAAHIFSRTWEPPPRNKTFLAR